MQTKSVDTQFEKVLEDNLPEHKQREHIDGEDEAEEATETVDPNLLKPVSNFTKNLIACKFAGALNNDPVATTKMMGVLKSLEGMTEGEARMFLQSIETSDISLMSDKSVTYLLKYISKYFVNPNNKESQENIIQDRFIRSSLSHKMTELFCHLGTWAGVFLFVVYAVESWSENSIILENDTKQGTPGKSKEDTH